jgi:hypothetical protein
MPDNEIAALKSTLQKMDEGLRWITEQLILIRKDGTDAELNRLVSAKRRRNFSAVRSKQPTKTKQNK